MMAITDNSACIERAYGELEEFCQRRKDRLTTDYQRNLIILILFDLPSKKM